MSQQHIAVLTLTVTADGAVSENRAVGFDGAQATTQGQKVYGASMTDAADGEGVAIITLGTAVLETGTAINTGDSLITDSQGRAMPATGNLELAAGAVAVTSSAANGALLTGADLPEFVFADALQGSTGAGEFIEVLLRR